MHRVRAFLTLIPLVLLSCATEQAAAPASDAADSKAKKEYGYEFNAEAVKESPPPSAPATERLPNGRLAPEAIQQVVRASFPKFKECYDVGLQRDPKLAGEIKVRFVIEEAGTVSKAATDSATLADKQVEGCVVGIFSSLSFPKSEGGIVTVVYPVQFAP